MSAGYTHFNILLVDDDPDILTISKLAMRDIKVLDVPLNILTATSKAEAIELFNQEEGPVSQIAVAIIDVVMESNTAGLELCEFIRQGLNNQRTQLYIRTGQPGIAPERAVLDQYDISGYFTKAEMNEYKLYSLVKSGVRQFFSSSLLENALILLQHLIAVGDSKEMLKATFAQVVQGSQPADAPADNAAYVAVDGETIWQTSSWDEPTALATKERLDAFGGTSFGPIGDKYVLDEEDEYHTMLLKVAASPPCPEVFIVQKYREPFAHPRDNRTITSYNVFKAVAALWAKAK